MSMSFLQRSGTWIGGACLITLALGLSGCAKNGGERVMVDEHVGIEVEDLRNADRVESLLDQLHAAASAADSKRYWSCFAPNAVFLGTDASERWTLEQFKAYAEPIFATGRGWTYVKIRRTVNVQNHETVWFDEMLQNAKYGTCRGSGVVVRCDDGAWRIAQYNLSVPIPNDMLEGVAGQIRQHEAAKKAAAGQ